MSTTYKPVQCNICLEARESTLSLHDYDENEINWFTKLQFVIPELEWLENYLICQSCIRLLEKAWEFKKSVLSLDTQRKSSFTKKEEYNEDILDFGDTCETSEYLFLEDKGLSCDICFKSFVTQTQLRQHTLQNHLEDNDNKIKDIFTCYDCGLGFNTKTNLLCHIGNDHGESKLCLICERRCPDRTALENHIKYEHIIKENKECACTGCSENFESEIKLNEHLKGCHYYFQYCTIEENVNEDLKHNKNNEDQDYHQGSECKNYYASKKNFNSHKLWCLKPKENKTDERTNKYNCDICFVHFNSVNELNLHNNLKHLQNKEQISIKKTKNRRGRKSAKTFCCEICNDAFEYVKLVVDHCMSVHGMQKKTIKPYNCEKCEMRFASSANLEQHRQYHDKNRSYICILCGKGFITKSDLIVHEYTHYNRRNYKCNHCDKAFNTNKNLRTHNLVVHTDRSLWKYACTICGKHFPLKTNYEQHVRRHTGEKNYACHICKKTFISKTEVKRHVMLHSNIKAFKCSSCSKEYKERRTYEIHLTRVHGIGNAKVPVREKKYVCHICPSQFYDKQKLSKHISSHSGLKPFNCYACDKKFSDNSYLTHHQKIVHNICDPAQE